MLLGIDHVVLATDDPDAAAAELERRLGLTAAGGGRHHALGTFNRLIWLGDAYLELIGVFDRDRAASSWLGPSVLEALARTGGLATWAIAVDDLEDALRWAPPDAGLVGPVDGERKRPDGQMVRWRLAHPPILSPIAPFLIEHDETAAEWSAEERGERAAEKHPVGGRARLVGVEVETPSPAIAAGRIRSVLAASVEPAGRAAVRVRLGLQEARFVVSRPGTAAAVVDVVVDAAVRTRVARIGDTEIRVRGFAPLETTGADTVAT